MKYKLLACDLDGTLNNSKGKLTEGNKDAIKKAGENGLRFVICSGRSQISVDAFNKELGLNVPGGFGISFNGGVVYKADTLEVLYERRMPREDALRVIEAIKLIDPETPVIVYVEGNLIYYTDENENIAGYASRVDIKKQKVDSFEEIPSDILKMLIRWDPEKLIKLHDSLKDKIEDICDIVFSDKHLLEFAPKGSNKSEGLSFLADYLGLDMSETAAMGDNFNDAEMICDAGLGIAVNNAVDEIKAMAGFVTKSNNDNDAVKEAIEMLLAQE